MKTQYIVLCGHQPAYNGIIEFFKIDNDEVTHYCDSYEEACEEAMSWTEHGFIYFNENQTYYKSQINNRAAIIMPIMKF